MKNRCYYCYNIITTEEKGTPAGKKGYHTTCSRKFFGLHEPPVLPYTQQDMLALAEKVIRSQVTVTGVQPKLSLGIEKLSSADKPARFTIVGLWGKYILKPQTEHFRNVPENEDLTMHLARLANINTVEHALIKLASGELAYITKRIDRYKNKKLHMEDMCQLTERLTEHKYNGSYEQITKAILKYAANPVLDATNFYEQVICSFLTGNNDMHLKNFSLIKDQQKQYHLAPAYDMVAASLVIKDNEELALTLNGKKRNINKSDFEIAMKSGGIDPKAVENIFNKFSNIIPNWHDFIAISFLPQDLKDAYHEIIEQRRKQLGI